MAHLRRHFKTEISVTKLGQFEKVMATNFLTEVAQVCWLFLSIMENYNNRETTAADTFANNWATFFHHLVTLTSMPLGVFFSGDQKSNKHFWRASGKPIFSFILCRAVTESLSSGVVVTYFAKKSLSPLLLRLPSSSLTLTCDRVQTFF